MLLTMTLFITTLKCNKINSKGKLKSLNNLKLSKFHLSHMFRVNQLRDTEKLLVHNLKMICKVIWIFNNHQWNLNQEQEKQDRFSQKEMMKQVLLVQSSIKNSDLWNSCTILITWNPIKMTKCSKKLILGEKQLSLTHFQDSNKNWNKGMKSKLLTLMTIITKFNLTKIKWAKRKVIEELKQRNSMQQSPLKWKKIKKDTNKIK